tara:strand:- start:28 stop:435 length:408 start_codon:yes stop_codon:yes gene_type:complete
MKKCNHCNQIKSHKEFYIQKRYRSNGKLYYDLRYRCISCERKHAREIRKDIGFKQSLAWEAEKRRQCKGTKHAKLSKINSQKHRDNMSDMYIRSLITKKSKTLKPKDIPKRVVDAYRISLGIKRELRVLKNKVRQ